MQTPRPAVARVLAVLAVLILLSTACGGGDEVDTLEATSSSSEKPHPWGATGDVWPSTQATTSTTDAADLVGPRLTFNGESCTYDGPTELTPGPFELVFLNESEENASVTTVIIDEGFTIQDVIDDLDAEPSAGQQPPWTRKLPPWIGEYRSWFSREPGKADRLEVDLEAGLYAMVCLRLSPHIPEDVVTVLGVWFGSGLTVEG